ncbi:MBL fold metallo-hydrolase [Tenacibaculum halocynthiae]|uniref:MBL fold metallo-hydrolase n=1 Tax=Tenacibaculum halocynthiae TaxID=1254437 RepID=UPI003895477E
MMRKQKIIILINLIFVFAACGDSENSSTPQPTIKENWYTTTKVTKNTYSIAEPKSSQRNVSYLIVGDEKAIMFDTGSGENSGQDGTKMIYKLKELTSLPITLLLSHFHFDHNQNIGEFKKVAFPDVPFLKQKVINGTYNFTAEDLFIGNYPKNVTVNEWLPIKTDIDLGNKKIQIINIPGHTSESVAIIDTTDKIAFLGDYLYNGELFLFDVDDINKYKESVDYLLSILDINYRLFGAHGTPEVSFNKLKDLQEFLKCIQESICTGVKEKYSGYNTLLYKNNDLSIRIFI